MYYQTPKLFNELTQRFYLKKVCHQSIIITIYLNLQEMYLLQIGNISNLNIQNSFPDIVCKVK